MPSEKIGKIVVKDVKVFKYRARVVFSNCVKDLSLSAFYRNNLFKGQMFSLEEFKEIEHDILLDKDYAHATHLAVKYALSRKQLDEKLSKKCPKQADRDKIINYLVSSSIFNEKANMEVKIESLKDKNYGVKKILMKLKEFGFSDNLISKVRITSKEDAIKVMIKKLLLRKYNSSSIERRAKIASSLLRYGFNEKEVKREVLKIPYFHHKIEIEHMKNEIEKYIKLHPNYERKNLFYYLRRKGYENNDIIEELGVDYYGFD